MRLPEALLECVVFLCAENDEGEIVYFGTAFYLAVENPEVPDGGGFGYLVTARHCVENAERAGFRNWGVRVNTNDDTQLYRLPYHQWLFPEDDGVDVAVFRAWPEDAHNPIGPGLFITPEILEEKSVGIGDELVVPGLFTYFTGDSQNIPIIRTGILAAAPTEDFVDDNTGRPFHAYLAELRSFGGLSGSPVFVRWEANSYFGRDRPAFYLLGMIRAHWDSFRDRLKAAPDESHALNLGIAMVTPLLDILTVVEDDNKGRRLDPQV